MGAPPGSFHKRGCYYERKRLHKESVVVVPTIPQSASSAPDWRESFSPTSGCRFRRTPARVPTAGIALRGNNPSVSFADSSRLRVSFSEPEGAAKFILRPGTPARRSRGWGENPQKPTKEPCESNPFHKTTPLKFPKGRASNAISPPDGWPPRRPPDTGAPYFPRS